MTSRTITATRRRKCQKQAQELTPATESPTESTKDESERRRILGNAEQDTVDHMRDMESSGRIDMDAYDGETNMDDNVDKYGKDKSPTACAVTAPNSRSLRH